MLKLRESLKTLEQFTRKVMLLKHAAASEKERSRLDDIVGESLLLQEALWQLLLALDEKAIVACEILS